MEWIKWRKCSSVWDVLRIFPIIFMYICFMENGIFGEEELPTTERDPGSPSFMDTRREVKVVRSGLAVLPCTVKNVGIRMVVWRRLSDDQFLTVGERLWTNDPRFFVDFDVGDDMTTTWDLLIKDVKFSDAGIYECQITSVELLTRHIELKVFEKATVSTRTRVPRTTTQTPVPSASLPSAEHHYLTHRQEMVTAGLPIRLVCNTSLGNSSLPRSSLEWFKDGDNIHTSSHILLTRYQFETSRKYVSELFINESTVEDTGEYECRLETEQLFAAKILVLPRTQSRSRKDQAHYYARDAMKTTKKVRNGGGPSTSSQGLLVSLMLLFVWLYRRNMFGSPYMYCCLKEGNYNVQNLT